MMDALSRDHLRIHWFRCGFISCTRYRNSAVPLNSRKPWRWMNWARLATASVRSVNHEGASILILTLLVAYTQRVACGLRRQSTKAVAVSPPHTHACRKK